MSQISICQETPAAIHPHEALELLAQDIAASPGAGGALLAIYAEQCRVLRLVLEAKERAPEAPLPSSVVALVERVVAAAIPGCDIGGVLTP
ncbi:MAG: hypothetical protein ACO3JL_20705 [Myxococcota bacterium]